MSDKKHIDRLFQEKLKHFEVTPSDSVWESIEKELHQKKRKRRVISLWWQVAGVAAVLALLFAIGYSVFNNSSETYKTLPTVVETNDADGTPDKTSDENSVSGKNQEESLASENSVKKGLGSDSTTDSILDKTQNNKVSVASTNRKSIERNDAQNIGINNDPTLIGPKIDNATASNNKNDGLKSSNLPEPDLNRTTIKEEQLDKEAFVSPVDGKINSLVVTNNSKKDDLGSKVDPTKPDTSLEEAITEVNELNEKEEGRKLSRWGISTNVAPVYFNSLGKGSSLDRQFVDNSKSGEINMSYGINASYAINEKLKIRAGVNKVNLGHNTNNVIVNRSEGVSSISSFSRSNSNIRFNEDSQNTMILSSQNLSFSAVPNVVETSVQSSINQELGFIELPLEVEYALLDNKLGVNVIGGFSTFFLDKNRVYTSLNGDKTLLGEANNINNTSYSANFGLGLNYNVSDKVILNLEPTFKYQINTFRDTSGDFQPFFIGIYTGLRYKF